MAAYQILACCIMVSCGANVARAQTMFANLPRDDKPFFDRPTQTYGTFNRIRGIAELSSETRLALAQAGIPIHYKNSNPSPKSLADVIAEECGEQPAAVTAFITENALTLNGLNSEDDEIAPGEVAAIPFCLRVETDVQVEVKQGDSPSSILVAEYGVSGPKTLDRFFKMNIPAITDAKIKKFTQNLAIGQTVVVPYSSEERVFIEDPTADKSLEDIVTSIDNTNTRAQLESVIVWTNSSASENFQLDYVPSFTFSGASGDVKCRGQVGETASVFDAQLLRQRFEVEIENRNRFFEGNQPEGAVVGLIDSGVNKAKDPTFFSNDLFHINYKELNSLSNQDNDDNQHKDDIFGTNFYQNSGIIDPLPKGLEEFHGTKMASLILGGPDLAKNWFGKATPPPIRLKVINFSSMYPRVRTVDATKLKDAIEYLKSQGADIVNLSLATSEKLLTLKNSIRGETGILFVVAAGNSVTGSGDNLTLFPLYPARYGGRASGNDHVVTVAAHDLSGALATFSNHSSEFVDFLAPGCAVKVRSAEANTTLENGTSAATAITSFAAGLIRTLGVQDPAGLKNRLIVGTNFDEDLKNAAWSSGRLDVVKAISVFHDVVTMKSNADELIFGKITDLSSLYQLCKSPPPDHDLAALRKVVYDVNDDGKAMIEFWTEVDDKLIREIRCEQALADDASLLVTLSDGQQRQIALNGVKDIVLATLKISD